MFLCIKERVLATNIPGIGPISLLSVPGKVFANVLLAILEPFLTSHWRPHQSGFSGGRLYRGPNLALYLLAEIQRAFAQPLNVAYINIKSA